MTLDELLLESLENLKGQLRRYAQLLSSDSDARDAEIERQRQDTKKLYEGLKGDVLELGTRLDYIRADTGETIDPFEVGLAPLDRTTRADAVKGIEKACESLDWPLSVLQHRISGDLVVRFGSPKRRWYKFGLFRLARRYTVSVGLGAAVVVGGILINLITQDGISGLWKHPWRSAVFVIIAVAAASLLAAIGKGGSSGEDNV